MQIQPLASGSAGNATLVTSGRTRVLVDAGLHVDELEERLAAAGVRPSAIDGILVTHRHKDHIRGTTDFARRHRCKVIATHRTLRSVGSEVNRRKHTIRPGNEFTVGGLRGLAFPVPHDAPEAVGFRLRDDQHIYGHITDLGHWTEAVVEGLRHCHVLHLEFNHEPERVRACPDYSVQLKERILGDDGHLSNEDAAELLRRLAWPGLRMVFLAHLSERTNDPRTALAAAEATRSGAPFDLRIAEQHRVTEPFELAPVTPDGAGSLR